MTEHAIDTLLAENRRYPPDPEFARDANAQQDLLGLSRVADHLFA